MTQASHPDPILKRRLRRTAAICIGVVAGMVGLAYAAVPLYDLFCRVTGFDGTPRVGTAGGSRILDHTIRVRFDANVAPGLDWRFAPEALEIRARLGETQTVFYKVRNAGAVPTAGIATFNVQPGQAGAYFVKIQCFCFNEQTLQPGEEMDVPVVFYVEPSLADEPNLRNLPSITLSYTYFASKNGLPVATTSAGAAQPNL
ncbi:MAG TPA: cytochrome c oxidase assembly protein [Beijerinckiaceae bacterium]